MRRLLSLNQHRKRWGAKNHIDNNVCFDALKTQIIDAASSEIIRGSNKSLDVHINNLRREFSGQPELLWYHARLIVLIRRDIRIKGNYNHFCALWKAEGAYLCEHLNLRWLVSACDTFAEQDSNPKTRAVAMMASLLCNTIKIYETERYICNTTEAMPDEARINTLQNQLFPLISGMSCFTVGTDDTLRNMLWRLEPFFDMEPVGSIVKTVWNRIQEQDTVFARMRSLHHRKRTSWWDA